MYYIIDSVFNLQVLIHYIIVQQFYDFLHDQ